MFGSYEIASTFVFGLITVYMVYRVIAKRLKIDLQEQIEQRNLAVVIFAGAYTFCQLWLTTESVGPATDALRTMVQVKDVFEVRMLWIAMGYSVALFAISVVIGYVLLSCTLKVLTVVTHQVDEFEELRAGNMATSIFLSLTLVATTTISKPALGTLLEGLVSYEYLNQVGSDATDRSTVTVPLTTPTTE